MTITSTDRLVGPLATNGVTVDFAFDFKVFEDTDVAVTLVTDGVEDLQVLTTDYTVALNTDQEVDPGGTVTFVAAPNNTDVYIGSQVPETQSTVFTNTGGFYPRVLNDALDRLTVLIQQIITRLASVVRFPVGETGGVLPSASQRAGNIFVFDALGAPDVLPISGFAGPTGATGPAGLSVLSGAGGPGAGLGSNGEWYINTATHELYGPKTAGAWGSPVSLIGPSGSGSVSSVGISAPAIFAISGSPVTGSGTLTLTLASQTANLVWASPNGSNGAPTFRALVAADFGTQTQNLALIAPNGSNGAPTFRALVAADLPMATAVEAKAGTSTKPVGVDVLWSMQAEQTLTDAATTAWDMSLGPNAKWTLGASRTLGTPTNPKAGVWYTLRVIQDGTGTRLVTWPASFNWGATGAPTLSTTAGKHDVISLYCTDAGTPAFDAFLGGKGF